MKKLAKTIMVQGTGSSAGKSFLVAGLCKVIKDLGFTVAPFKAQNMALNSYVTKEGLEIGTAQAMQAEASGIEPSVEMNPILIKPEGDRKSQIVLNGKAIGSKSAYDYHFSKDDLKKLVENSLTSLREKYDYVVIEGAGSPVEMNLKKHDIVNMFVAKLCKAKVIIVGDIDKGGIFASLIGTYDLLDDYEKSLVHGFVINKFRGDPKLLGDGLMYIQNKTNTPILGVLPFDPTICLKEEDSHNLGHKLSKTPKDNPLVVGIVRFPHISNYDEFNLLEQRDDIELVLLDSYHQICSVHVLILPGSKKTVSDLNWLKETKIFEAIQRRHQLKLPIVGICGGYQMMSRTIEDFNKVESKESLTAGLCLLPQKTVFEKDKTLLQVKWSLKEKDSVFLEGLCPKELFSGYEIHFGKVVVDNEASIRNFLVKENSGGRQDFGVLGLADFPVMGTLIHGLFANEKVLDSLVHSMKKWFFMKPVHSEIEFNEPKDDVYQKLGKLISDHLDLKELLA